MKIARRTSSVLLVLMVVSVQAKMMMPPNVPAARVIKTAEAAIKKAPQNPENYYVLGRIQYSLFCASDPEFVRLYGDEKHYRFPSAHTTVYEFQDLKPKADAKNLALISSSMANLKKAISLDNGNQPGLYSLTLACAYEASASIANKISPKYGSKTVWLRKALQYYEICYAATSELDLKQQYAQMPMTYERWISIEAGEAIIRLNPKHPKIKEIKAHQAEVAKLPSGPITPLIFSLDSKVRSLTELLDPSKTVNFDLDGTGAKQKWTWVKPQTAFLVWMPNGIDEVHSGRQLFGSATWWMMYPNAYSALASLDDNADGWIREKEFEGLAIWQDFNQNGVSDYNEIRTLQQAGIKAIYTKATGKTGSSLVSVGGLILNNGQKLPTYDWMATPVALASSRKMQN